MADLGKTSTGLQANVAGLLTYALGWITGLVFVLLEKENRFVRFHAIQSIALSVVLIVAAMVGSVLPGIGPVLAVLVNLGGLVIWIICMVKSYQGQEFKLPVIGDFAAKQVGGPSASS